MPHFLYFQTSLKTIDQIDLLREQQKILSGEVAFHSSALKRLSEEATRNPQNEKIQVIKFFHWPLLLLTAFDV